MILRATINSLRNLLRNRDDDSLHSGENRTSALSQEEREVARCLDTARQELFIGACLAGRSAYSHARFEHEKHIIAARRGHSGQAQKLGRLVRRQLKFTTPSSPASLRLLRAQLDR